MLRPFIALASLALYSALAPALASAQAAGRTAPPHVHTPGMSHDSAQAATRPTPTRAGQEAFATLAEVVRILSADPRTDWAKVNLETLRQHLIDMDEVTMRSAVRQESIPDGVVFSVTGTGRTREAIRRMALAHGMTITPADGFTWSAREIPDGAEVTVRVRAGAGASDDAQGGTRAVARLRALGFHGLLTLGDHHVLHHIGLADGSMKHEE
ncbi:MAG: hypothetical protein ACKVS7_16335 [Gemmatimonadaceae bacterium]